MNTLWKITLATPPPPPSQFTLGTTHEWEEVETVFAFIWKLILAQDNSPRYPFTPLGCKDTIKLDYFAPETQPVSNFSTQSQHTNF